MVLKDKLIALVKGMVLPALMSLSAGSGIAATSQWRLDLTSQTLYESNIYHSFDDSLETGALLNVIDLEGDWRWHQSSQIRHEVRSYASMDLYSGFSERNQTAFGAAYEPYWRYNRKGKLSFGLDVSRRNKDLVDDAGQILARTLKKWQVDAIIRHDYNFGRFDTEVSLRYGLDNYDEETGAISYDYSAYSGRARLAYDITSKLEGRATLDVERRNYDERRTYTVQYGAFVGRPFEIREYTLTDVEVSAIYAFSRHNDIRVDINYAVRTENFENFYGYDVRQYRLTFDLQPAQRHRVRVSARYKDKQYANYWNSSIGRNNRVWVEYADLKIEYEYQLVRSLLVSGYLRNYNKVSNYHAADYHDLTAGLGLQTGL